MATRKPSAKAATAANGPGRPSLFEDGKWKPIHCKASPAQHATFKALGGSEWLRGILDEEAKKLAKKAPEA